MQNRDRLRENRFVVAKGEGVRGGMEWEAGVSKCKLLDTGWITTSSTAQGTINMFSIL